MRLKSLDGVFHLTAIILIIAAGFFVYINSVSGQFIWDDDWLIKNNVYIKDLSRPMAAFSTSEWTNAPRRYHFWRPLQVLSYMLDYSVWGLDTKGYHLTNIGLHILTCLGLYWFINILFKDKLLSLFTGIFFTIHPVHTEAVSYISGRADPLVLLLLLLCFIFYIKSIESGNKRFYPLMVLSYAGALLSRENSLIFPALLLLYHYTLRKRIRVREFVSVLVITAVYILLRSTALRQLLPDYSGSAATLIQRIPGFFTAAADYIRLLVMPFGLHMAYGDKVFAANEPRVLIGIIMTAALLIFASRRIRRDAVASFGILWFFIALLPMSNLYPIGSYMAEHWLYMPSIGFFLLLSEGLCFAYRQKGLRAVGVLFAALFFIFYSYLTIKQNGYWQNPAAFYQRTIEYSPGSSQLHYNLANIYRAEGRTDEAIASYQRAIELKSDDAESYNNLGITFFDMGRTREAMTCYEKAIEANPGFSYPYCNLARAYDTLGDRDKALELYKNAVTIEPGNASAHYNLSILYYNKGMYDPAVKHCGRAVSLGYKADPAYVKLLERT